MSFMIDEIDGEIIANSLCLDPLDGYYVLVEGESDELFYSKFLDSDNCNIEICHGKQNILDAIKILDLRKKNVKYVGLVDKDYEFLIEEIKSDNLISTDSHSLETMCVTSRSFNNVMNEYFDSKKVKDLESRMAVTIVEHILGLALEIAHIRIISQKDKYFFRFKPSKEKPKELDYSKFICKNKFEFLGVDSLLDTIRRYYNQAVDLENTELKMKISNLNLGNYDVRDLCHGHDISRIISLGLKKAIGKNSTKDASVEEIERSLRLAYSREDFYSSGIKRKLDNISLNLVK